METQEAARGAVVPWWRGVLTLLHPPALLWYWIIGPHSWIYRIYRNIKSGFDPRFRRRRRLLSWVAAASGRDVADLASVWQDGTILCDVLHRSCPSACQGHEESTVRDTFRHAQALAYRCLFLQPAFTDIELSRRELTPNIEKRLFRYLQNLRQAISKKQLNRSVEDESDAEAHIAEEYIARGMGLIMASRNQRAIFYVYSRDGSSLMDIHIEIRGPGEDFGSILVTGSESFDNPSGASIPVEYRLTDEYLRVSYQARSVGHHELSISRHGYNVPGSPFLVTVDEISEKVPKKRFNSIEWFTEDEERRQKEIQEKKKKAKVKYRIVDFVTEKMYLTEDGKLLKVPPEEIVSTTPAPPDFPAPFPPPTSGISQLTPASPASSTDSKVTCKKGRILSPRPRKKRGDRARWINAKQEKMKYIIVKPQKSELKRVSDAAAQVTLEFQPSMFQERCKRIVTVCDYLLKHCPRQTSLEIISGAGSLLQSLNSDTRFNEGSIQNKTKLNETEDDDDDDVFISTKSSSPTTVRTITYAERCRSVSLTYVKDESKEGQKETERHFQDSDTERRESDSSISQHLASEARKNFRTEGKTKFPGRRTSFSLINQVSGSKSLTNSTVDEDGYDLSTLSEEYTFVGDIHLNYAGSNDEVKLINYKQCSDKKSSAVFNPNSTELSGVLQDQANNSSILVNELIGNADKSTEATSESANITTVNDFTINHPSISERLNESTSCKVINSKGNSVGKIIARFETNLSSDQDIGCLPADSLAESNVNEYNRDVKNPLGSYASEGPVCDLKTHFEKENEMLENEKKLQVEYLKSIGAPLSTIKAKIELFERRVLNESKNCSRSVPDAKARSKISTNIQNEQESMTFPVIEDEHLFRAEPAMVVSKHYAELQEISINTENAIEGIIFDFQTKGSPNKIFPTQAFRDQIERQEKDRDSEYKLDTWDPGILINSAAIESPNPIIENKSVLYIDNNSRTTLKEFTCVNSDSNTELVTDNPQVSTDEEGDNVQSMRCSINNFIINGSSDENQNSSSKYCIPKQKSFESESETTVIEDTKECIAKQIPINKESKDTTDDSGSDIKINTHLVGLFKTPDLDFKSKPRDKDQTIHEETKSSQSKNAKEIAYNNPLSELVTVEKIDYTTRQTDLLNTTNENSDFSFYGDKKTCAQESLHDTKNLIYNKNKVEMIESQIEVLTNESVDKLANTNYIAHKSIENAKTTIRNNISGIGKEIIRVDDASSQSCTSQANYLTPSNGIGKDKILTKKGPFLPVTGFEKIDRAVNKDISTLERTEDLDLREIANGSSNLDETKCFHDKKNSLVECNKIITTEKNEVLENTNLEHMKGINNDLIKEENPLQDHEKQINFENLHTFVNDSSIKETHNFPIVGLTQKLVQVFENIYKQNPTTDIPADMDENIALTHSINPTIPSTKLSTIVNETKQTEVKGLTRKLVKLFENIYEPINLEQKGAPTVYYDSLEEKDGENKVGEETDFLVKRDSPQPKNQDDENKNNVDGTISSPFNGLTKKLIEVFDNISDQSNKLNSYTEINKDVDKSEEQYDATTKTASSTKQETVQGNGNTPTVSEDKATNKQLLKRELSDISQEITIATKEEKETFKEINDGRYKGVDEQYFHKRNNSEYENKIMIKRKSVVAGNITEATVTSYEHIKDEQKLIVARAREDIIALKTTITEDQLKVDYVDREIDLPSKEIQPLKVVEECKTRHEIENRIESNQTTSTLDETQTEETKISKMETDSKVEPKVNEDVTKTKHTLEKNCKQEDITENTKEYETTEESHYSNYPSVSEQQSNVELQKGLISSIITKFPRDHAMKNNIESEQHVGKLVEDLMDGTGTGTIEKEGVIEPKGTVETSTNEATYLSVDVVGQEKATEKRSDVVNLIQVSCTKDQQVILCVNEEINLKQKQRNPSKMELKCISIKEIENLCESEQEPKTIVADETKGSKLKNERAIEPTEDKTICKQVLNSLVDKTKEKKMPLERNGFESHITVEKHCNILQEECEIMKMESECTTERGTEENHGSEQTDRKLFEHLQDDTNTAKKENEKVLKTKYDKDITSIVETNTSLIRLDKDEVIEKASKGESTLETTMSSHDQKFVQEKVNGNVGDDGQNIEHSKTEYKFITIQDTENRYEFGQNVVKLFEALQNDTQASTIETVSGIQQNDSEDLNTSGQPLMNFNDSGNVEQTVKSEENAKSLVTIVTEEQPVVEQHFNVEADILQMETVISIIQSECPKEDERAEFVQPVKTLPKPVQDYIKTAIEEYESVEDSKCNEDVSKKVDEKKRRMKLKEGEITERAKKDPQIKDQDQQNVKEHGHAYDDLQNIEHSKSENGSKSIQKVKYIENKCELVQTVGEKVAALQEETTVATMEPYRGNKGTEMKFISHGHQNVEQLLNVEGGLEKTGNENLKVENVCDTKFGVANKCEYEQTVEKLVETLQNHIKTETMEKDSVIKPIGSEDTNTPEQTIKSLEHTDQIQTMVKATLESIELRKDEVIDEGKEDESTLNITNMSHYHQNVEPLINKDVKIQQTGNNNLRTENGCDNIIEIANKCEYEQTVGNLVKVQQDHTKAATMINEIIKEPKGFEDKKKTEETIKRFDHTQQAETILKSTLERIESKEDDVLKKTKVDEPILDNTPVCLDNENVEQLNNAKVDLQHNENEHFKTENEYVNLNDISNPCKYEQTVEKVVETLQDHIKAATMENESVNVPKCAEDTSAPGKTIKILNHTELVQNIVIETLESNGFKEDEDIKKDKDDKSILKICLIGHDHQNVEQHVNTEVALEQKGNEHLKMQNEYDTIDNTANKCQHEQTVVYLLETLQNHIKAVTMENESLTKQKGSEETITVEETIERLNRTDRLETTLKATIESNELKENEVIEKTKCDKAKFNITSISHQNVEQLNDEEDDLQQNKNENLKTENECNTIVDIASECEYEPVGNLVETLQDDIETATMENESVIELIYSKETNASKQIFGGLDDDDKVETIVKASNESMESKKNEVIGKEKGEKSTLAITFNGKDHEKIEQHINGDVDTQQKLNENLKSENEYDTMTDIAKKCKYKQSEERLVETMQDHMKTGTMEKKVFIEQLGSEDTITLEKSIKELDHIDQVETMIKATLEYIDLKEDEVNEKRKEGESTLESTLIGINHQNIEQYVEAEVDLQQKDNESLKKEDEYDPITNIKNKSKYEQAVEKLVVSMQDFVKSGTNANESVIVPIGSNYTIKPETPIKKLDRTDQVETIVEATLESNDLKEDEVIEKEKADKATLDIIYMSQVFQNVEQFNNAEDDLHQNEYQNLKTENEWEARIDIANECEEELTGENLVEIVQDHIESATMIYESIVEPKVSEEKNASKEILERIDVDHHVETIAKATNESIELKVNDVLEKAKGEESTIEITGRDHKNSEQHVDEVVALEQKANKNSNTENEYNTMTDTTYKCKYKEILIENMQHHIKEGTMEKESVIEPIIFKDEITPEKSFKRLDHTKQVQSIAKATLESKELKEDEMIERAKDNEPTLDIKNDRHDIQNVKQHKNADVDLEHKETDNIKTQDECDTKIDIANICEHELTVGKIVDTMQDHIKLATLKNERDIESKGSEEMNAPKQIHRRLLDKNHVKTIVATIESMEVKEYEGSEKAKDDENTIEISLIGNDCQNIEQHVDANFVLQQKENENLKTENEYDTMTEFANECKYEQTVENFVENLEDRIKAATMENESVIETIGSEDTISPETPIRTLDNTNQVESIVKDTIGSKGEKEDEVIEKAKEDESTLDITHVSHDHQNVEQHKNAEDDLQHKENKNLKTERVCDDMIDIANICEHELTVRNQVNTLQDHKTLSTLENENDIKPKESKETNAPKQILGSLDDNDQVETIVATLESMENEGIEKVKDDELILEIALIGNDYQNIEQYVDAEVDLQQKENENLKKENEYDTMTEFENECKYEQTIENFVENLEDRIKAATMENESIIETIGSQDTISPETPIRTLDNTNQVESIIKDTLESKGEKEDEVIEKAKEDESTLDITHVSHDHQNVEQHKNAEVDLQHKENENLKTEKDCDDMIAIANICEHELTVGKQVNTLQDHKTLSTLENENDIEPKRPKETNAPKQIRGRLDDNDQVETIVATLESIENEGIEKVKDDELILEIALIGNDYQNIEQYVDAEVDLQQKENENLKMENEYDTMTEFANECKYEQTIENFVENLEDRIKAATMENESIIETIGSQDTISPETPIRTLDNTYQVESIIKDSKGEKEDEVIEKAKEDESTLDITHVSHDHQNVEQHKNAEVDLQHKENENLKTEKDCDDMIDIANICEHELTVGKQVNTLQDHKTLSTLENENDIEPKGSEETNAPKQILGRLDDNGEVETIVATLESMENEGIEKVKDDELILEIALIGNDYQNIEQCVDAEVDLQQKENENLKKENEYDTMTEFANECKYEQTVENLVENLEDRIKAATIENGSVIETMVFEETISPEIFYKTLDHTQVESMIKAPLESKVLKEQEVIEKAKEDEFSIHITPVIHDHQNVEQHKNTEVDLQNKENENIKTENKCDTMIDVANIWEHELTVGKLVDTLQDHIKLATLENESDIEPKGSEETNAQKQILRKLDDNEQVETIVAQHVDANFVLQQKENENLKTENEYDTMTEFSNECKYEQTVKKLVETLQDRIKPETMEKESVIEPMGSEDTISPETPIKTINHTDQVESIVKAPHEIKEVKEDEEIKITKKDESSLEFALIGHDHQNVEQYVEAEDDLQHEENENLKMKIEYDTMTDIENKCKYKQSKEKLTETLQDHIKAATMENESAIEKICFEETVIPEKTIKRLDHTNQVDILVTSTLESKQLKESEVIEKSKEDIATIEITIFGQDHRNFEKLVNVEVVSHYDKNESLKTENECDSMNDIVNECEYEPIDGNLVETLQDSIEASAMENESTIKPVGSEESITSEQMISSRDDNGLIETVVKATLKDIELKEDRVIKKAIEDESTLEMTFTSHDQRNIEQLVNAEITSQLNENENLKTENICDTMIDIADKYEYEQTVEKLVETLQDHIKAAPMENENVPEPKVSEDTNTPKQFIKRHDLTDQVDAIVKATLESIELKEDEVIEKGKEDEATIEITLISHDYQNVEQLVNADGFIQQKENEISNMDNECDPMIDIANKCEYEQNVGSLVEALQDHIGAVTMENENVIEPKTESPDTDNVNSTEQYVDGLIDPVQYNNKVMIVDNEIVSDEKFSEDIAIVDERSYEIIEFGQDKSIKKHIHSKEVVITKPSDELVNLEKNESQLMSINNEVGSKVHFITDGTLIDEQSMAEPLTFDEYKSKFPAKDLYLQRISKIALQPDHTPSFDPECNRPPNTVGFSFDIAKSNCEGQIAKDIIKYHKDQEKDYQHTSEFFTCSNEDLHGGTNTPEEVQPKTSSKPFQQQKYITGKIKQFIFSDRGDYNVNCTDDIRTKKSDEQILILSYKTIEGDRSLETTSTSPEPTMLSSAILNKRHLAKGNEPSNVDKLKQKFESQSTTTASRVDNKYIPSLETDVLTTQLCSNKNDPIRCYSKFEENQLSASAINYELSKHEDLMKITDDLYRDESVLQETVCDISDLKVWELSHDSSTLEFQNSSEIGTTSLPGYPLNSKKEDTTYGEISKFNNSHCEGVKQMLSLDSEMLNNNLLTVEQELSEVISIEDEELDGRLEKEISTIEAMEMCSAQGQDLFSFQENKEREPTGAIGYVESIENEKLDMSVQQQIIEIDKMPNPIKCELNPVFGQDSGMFDRKKVIHVDSKLLNFDHIEDDISSIEDETLDEEILTEISKIESVVYAECGKTELTADFSIQDNTTLSTTDYHNTTGKLIDDEELNEKTQRIFQEVEKSNDESADYVAMHDQIEKSQSAIGFFSAYCSSEHPCSPYPSEAEDKLNNFVSGKRKLVHIGNEDISSFDDNDEAFIEDNKEEVYCGDNAFDSITTDGILQHDMNNYEFFNTSTSNENLNLFKDSEKDNSYCDANTYSTNPFLSSLPSETTGAGESYSESPHDLKDIHLSMSNESDSSEFHMWSSNVEFGEPGDITKTQDGMDFESIISAPNLDEALRKLERHIQDKGDNFLWLSTRTPSPSLQSLEKYFKDGIPCFDTEQFYNEVSGGMIVDNSLSSQEHSLVENEEEAEKVDIWATPCENVPFCTYVQGSAEADGLESVIQEEQPPDWIISPYQYPRVIFGNTTQMSIIDEEDDSRKSEPTSPLQYKCTSVSIDENLLPFDIRPIFGDQMDKRLLDNTEVHFSTNEFQSDDSKPSVAESVEDFDSEKKHSTNYSMTGNELSLTNKIDGEVLVESNETIIHLNQSNENKMDLKITTPEPIDIEYNKVNKKNSTNVNKTIKNDCENTSKSETDLIFTTNTKEINEVDGFSADHQNSSGAEFNETNRVQIEGKKSNDITYDANNVLENNELNSTLEFQQETNQNDALDKVVNLTRDKKIREEIKSLLEYNIDSVTEEIINEFSVSERKLYWDMKLQKIRDLESQSNVHSGPKSLSNIKSGTVSKLVSSFGQTNGNSKHSAAFQKQSIVKPKTTTNQVNILLQTDNRYKEENIIIAEKTKEEPCHHTQCMDSENTVSATASMKLVSHWKTYWDDIINEQTETNKTRPQTVHKIPSIQISEDDDFGVTTIQCDDVFSDQSSNQENRNTKLFSAPVAEAMKIENLSEQLEQETKLNFNKVETPVQNKAKIENIGELTIKDPSTDVLSVPFVPRSRSYSTGNIDMEFLTIPKNACLPVEYKDNENAQHQNEFKMRFERAKQFFKHLEQSGPGDIKGRDYRSMPKLDLRIKNRKTSVDSDSGPEIKPQKKRDHFKGRKKRRRKEKDTCKIQSAPTSDTETSKRVQRQESCDSFGGSVKIRKVSERFHVKDLFRDISDKQGFFKGIPNRAAVLASLKSVDDVRAISPYEMDYGDLRSSASLGNIPSGFQEEYPYLPTTPIHSFRPRSALGLNLIPRRELIDEKF